MRFIAILLIIAGLISGWFYLQKKRVESSAKAWAAQLAAHLPDQVLEADTAETKKKAETNVYWILFYFDKLAVGGMDPVTVLADACDQLKMTTEQSTVLRNNLMANYEAAKKYRIYEDVTNIVKLEQGIPPLMKMSGWEDETVALSYIIPPSMAPEAAGATANFMLMPAIVNDAQGGRVTTSMVDQAKAMERAKIITKTSLEELVATAKKAATEAR